MRIIYQKLKTKNSNLFYSFLIFIFMPEAVNDSPEKKSDKCRADKNRQVFVAEVKDIALENCKSDWNIEATNSRPASFWE